VHYSKEDKLPKLVHYNKEDELLKLVHYNKEDVLLKLVHMQACTHANYRYTKCALSQLVYLLYSIVQKGRMP